MIRRKQSFVAYSGCSAIEIIRIGLASTLSSGLAIKECATIERFPESVLIATHRFYVGIRRPKVADRLLAIFERTGALCETLETNR